MNPLTYCSLLIRAAFRQFTVEHTLQKGLVIIPAPIHNSAVDAVIGRRRKKKEKNQKRSLQVSI